MDCVDPLSEFRGLAPATIPVVIVDSKKVDEVTTTSYRGVLNIKESNNVVAKKLTDLSSHDQLDTLIETKNVLISNRSPTSKVEQFVTKNAPIPKKINATVSDTRRRLISAKSVLPMSTGIDEIIANTGTNIEEGTVFKKGGTRSFKSDGSLSKAAPSARYKQASTANTKYASASPGTDSISDEPFTDDDNSIEETFTFTKKRKVSSGKIDKSAKGVTKKKLTVKQARRSTGTAIETGQKKSSTTKKKPPAESTKVNKKDPILLLPEVQLAKQRIQSRIKQDAAREFLKLRATAGTSGKSTNDDAKKIVKMYNALGYNYVTIQSISTEAETLVRSCKKWKEAIKISGTDEYLPNLDKDGDEIPPPRTVKNEDTVILSVSNNGTTPNNDVNSNALHELPTSTADEIMEDESPKPRNKGGRPKGTTNDNPNRLRRYRKKCPQSSERKQKIELTTKCAELYHSEKQAAMENNVPVPAGTLERIVAQVEQEFGVPKGLISLHTIRSRITRKNLSGMHRSQIPLLGDAEAEVVDYCVKLAKMGASLDKEQTILIAEEVAKRRNIYDSILMEKKKRNMADTEKDDEFKPFGSSWFIGFTNRNEQTILSRTGHELRYIPRHFQLRLDHFKLMYDIVYDAMVSAGVAEKIANAAIYDFDGNRLNSENGRIFSYGLPTRYRIIKPEFFLFVDELGSRSIEFGINVFYRGNRNNDPDESGHIAGQTFSLLVEPESAAGCTNTDTNEMTYSVYCFIDGSGNVVTCVIVFKSEKNIQDIPIIVRWGIDMFEPLVNDGETDMVLFQNNCGPGQAMQGGPTCNYNGVDVPCVVGTSVTGVMTSELLLEVVASLDNLNVYDRSTGVKPFLLLDGHTCVLDLAFVDYTHDSEHEWVVSCGLHRDTHLLRVSDPCEFNNTFKEMIASTRDRILTARQHDPTPFFYASDIIPIVRQSWEGSYDDPIKMKRSLSLRGWNPMNYALMLHPILSKKGELGDAKKGFL